jgi:hypothetical protein
LGNGNYRNGEDGEIRGAASINYENEFPPARRIEAALRNADFSPRSMAVSALLSSIFSEDLFSLRVGITIEYQLEVRDVFSIGLETGCPVGAQNPA